MKTFAALLAALTLLISLPAHAEEPSGKAIFEKMKDARELESSVARVRLKITNKRGQTRERVIEWQQKEVDGLAKSLARFVEPADVRGTGFLVLEQKGRDDDQYLYLPALRKTKRISSSQKSDKFMGSDFYYEDLEPLDVDEGEHTRLKAEPLQGKDCWVVETKVTKEDSTYSKIVTWVRQDIWLPFMVDFYDTRGELLKKWVITKFEEVDGEWVIMKSRMQNMQDQTHTDMIVESMQLNVEIGDDTFTRKNLEDWN